MRLDLYITSKTTIHKRGTGVYVRENRQTVELKTMDDDLSPELKEMFDKVQQKIDSKQNVGLFGGDWRWGKSWCYLTELQSYLDERLERCKAAILREHSCILCQLEQTSSPTFK